jgi:hypothetical protein
MSLEKFRNRALLLKVETTEGTDATPTAGADAFQLFDGASGLTADKIERPIDRPFLGNTPFVNSNIRGFIEGACEIVPPAAIADGAAKAPIDALLRIAGMAKTYTAADAGPPEVKASILYNLISTAFPSGTGYFYHAGTIWKLLGARANLSSIEMAIGNYLRAQMRVEGNCQVVDEAALPGGLDFSAFTAPVVNSTETMELKLNGFAVEGKSMTVDLGNQLATVEHTEARINRIQDRRSTVKALFYRPSKANFDPFALWKAGTIIPIVGTILDPATNMQSQMTARTQIEDVRPTEIDGDYGYEITGRCIPSDAGGDELLLEFSDQS